MQKQKQKKKEEDEQLKWRHRGARRAIHTYSELGAGADAPLVVNMIFGGLEETAMLTGLGTRKVPLTQNKVTEKAIKKLAKVKPPADYMTEITRNVFGGG